MEPRLATWKGKKDYRVPLSDGTSTILKGVMVKVSEEASQQLFPIQLDRYARGGELSTNREGNLQVTILMVVRLSVIDNLRPRMVGCLVLGCS